MEIINVRTWPYTSKTPTLPPTPKALSSIWRNTSFSSISHHRRRQQNTPPFIVVVKCIVNPETNSNILALSLVFFQPISSSNGEWILGSSPSPRLLVRVSLLRGPQLPMPRVGNQMLGREGGRSICVWLFLRREICGKVRRECRGREFDRTNPASDVSPRAIL